MTSESDTFIYVSPHPFRIYDEDNMLLGEVDARSETFALITASEKFKISPLKLKAIAHDR
jgi:hypothetical protein